MLCWRCLVSRPDHSKATLTLVSNLSTIKTKTIQQSNDTNPEQWKRDGCTTKQLNAVWSLVEIKWMTHKCLVNGGRDIDNSEDAM